MKRNSIKDFLSKALVVGSLIACMLIGSLAAPTQTHAQTGAQLVYDPLNHVVNAITSLATGDSKIKQYVLDPLAYSVAHAVLQSVVNSTVRWINSGFNGSPAFATNLTQSLLQVGDAAANTFIRQLVSNSAIRSPFQTQIASAVGTNYRQSTSANGFFTQNPFTLGRFSPNPTAFLAGNFNQGGFDAWFSANDNPANNPYGAYQIAMNAVNGQVLQAQGLLQSEFLANSGFLSYRGNCQTTTTGQSMAGTAASPAAAAAVGTTATTDILGGTSGGGIAPTAITPITSVGANPANGLTLGAAAAASVGVSVTAPPTAVTANVPTAVTGITPITSVGANPSASLAASLSPSSGCQSQNIITPGSVIANSLYKSLGSGVDSLVSAQQFGEIVNALLGQLVNHVLGPGGLFGLSQPSAATGGVAYFNQTTPPPSSSSGGGTISPSITISFTQIVAGQVTALQTFQTEENAIAAAAQSAKAALQSSTCSPNAQALIATTVQPVIDQTTTALSSAAASITALNKIQTELPAATAASATTAQVQLASDDYACFLSTGTVTVNDVCPQTSSTGQVTNAEITQATVASTNSGTAIPPSTITQMNQIAQAAASCSVPTTTTTTTTNP